MAQVNFPDTAGKPTDGSFQYVENNVRYSWNGVYWEANTAASFDDRYLLKTGDTATGDIALKYGDLSISQLGDGAKLTASSGTGTVEAPSDVAEGQSLFDISMGGAVSDTNAMGVTFNAKVGDSDVYQKVVIEAQYVGKGEEVEIVTAGNTDFAQWLGAPNNNPGTVFTTTNRGWDYVRNTTGTVKSLSHLASDWSFRNIYRTYTGVFDQSLGTMGRTLAHGPIDSLRAGVFRGGFMPHHGICSRAANGVTTGASIDWHNTGIVFPNKSMVYLTLVTASGNGNLIASEAGFVVSAAYHKTYHSIGKGNHYGNGTISVSLDASSAASVNLMFKYDVSNEGNFNAYIMPMGAYF